MIIMHQRISRFIWLLLVLSDAVAYGTLIPPSDASSTAKEKRLSRHKRYVAFPEGSSLSGALCLTIGVIGNPNVNYMSYALNWGVAYDLPNETWVRQHAHGFKSEQNTKPVVQRRSRRDLYKKIEIAMDDMGFNGHACIARALCESSKYLQHFHRERGNMIEEIVKTIFSLPREPVESHEPHEVHHYDRIYRRARREVLDCSVQYPGCSFSLLELALGKYSVEPSNDEPGGGGVFRNMRPFSFM